MKFNKYCLIGLCVVLFVNQAFSENEKELLDVIVLPVAIKLLPALAIPPPIGPIILASLGLMQICSGIFDDKKGSETETSVEKPLTKVDLMEVRTAIIDEIKTLDTHLFEETARVIRLITMAIETNGLFEDMRQQLDYFQRFYADKLKIVINDKKTGIVKNLTVQELLNYSSDYRVKLRSFINKFIKPNVSDLLLLKPIKLFYEFILEKENYLASTDDDCNSDSLHNKIYKSFMYILKVLTEAYVISISAHVVKYQEALKNGPASDAEDLKENALILINEYKSDAAALIETTQWALNKASREIRNCGQFKLEEGKTFVKVSFSHTIPKMFNLEDKSMFEYTCKAEGGLIDMSVYEVGKCSAYRDVIPIGSRLEIPVKLKFPDADQTPYSSMKIKKMDGTEEIFGHKYHDFAININLLIHQDCYTTFCRTFKKNLYAISTQRVAAEPGNVITGLRFRMKNSIVYIDIQQGKFLNLLSVDPATVFWTETPETNEIEYFGAQLHKFELGDFVLENNSVLTSIQLKKTIYRNGMITIITDGLTPPYMNNTESVRYRNLDFEFHELELIDADDAAVVGVNSKNLVSKAPVKDKRYFVNFQPSDFKKGFGQATIPSIDIREVCSNPPAPLNGMGIYHEAANGSGGLIALKLITPNFIDLVDVLKEF